MNRAYDSNALRDLKERGATAVIPPRSNRVDEIDYDRECTRHLVENFIWKLKHFRVLRCVLTRL